MFNCQLSIYPIFYIPPLFKSKFLVRLWDEISWEALIGFGRFQICWEALDLGYIRTKFQAGWVNTPGDIASQRLVYIIPPICMILVWIALFYANIGVQLPHWLYIKTCYREAVMYGQNFVNRAEISFLRMGQIGTNGTGLIPQNENISGSDELIISYNLSVLSVLFVLFPCSLFFLAFFPFQNWFWDSFLWNRQWDRWGTDRGLQEYGFQARLGKLAF